AGIRRGMGKHKRGAGKILSGCPLPARDPRGLCTSDGDRAGLAGPPGLARGGREDPALTSRRTAATSGRGDVESSKQASWYQVRPPGTGVSVTIRRIDVSLWAGDEPVDRPLTRGCVVDHVQLAVSVFSEGDDVEGRVQQQAGAPGATARQRAPGASRAEVAE